MLSKPLTNVNVRYMIEATRQQVIKEFSHLPIGASEPVARVQDMADEIVRLRAAAQWAETVASAELEQLRRVLAALREPSEAVIDAAVHELFYEAATRSDTERAIRAAFAAAEQEVQGGT